MTTTILVNKARVNVPVVNRFGEEVNISVTIENLVVQVPEGCTTRSIVDQKVIAMALDEAEDSPLIYGNGDGEYSIIEDAVPYIAILETTSREEAEKLFQKWNSVASKYRRQLDLMDQAT